MSSFYGYINNLNRYDLLVSVAMPFVECSVVDSIVNAKCLDGHILPFSLIQKNETFKIFCTLHKNKNLS